MSPNMVGVVALVACLVGLYFLLGGAARAGKKAAQYGLRIFMPMHLGFFGLPVAVFMALGFLPGELQGRFLPLVWLSFALWVIPMGNILRRMGASGLGLCIIQALTGIGLGFTVLAVIALIIFGIGGAALGAASVESGINQAIEDERKKTLDEERRRGNTGMTLEDVKPGEFERTIEAVRRMDDDEQA